ncbi:MAG: hypothetical protein H6684_08290 [Deltaproteobacteria bacterium]|nr:hypothetical protein [Deltaproteobacteria bacterium]
MQLRNWSFLLFVLVGLLALVAVAPACGGDDDDDDDASDDDDDDDAGVDCEDGLCILTGTIKSDVTMTADNEYLLSGGVFIGDDATSATLTIEAGTRIYGESSSNGMLVISRGSKIMAEGTADAPIVFSSSKSDGSRARGDWGGLILNGRAPVNNCNAGTDAAFCEALGEGGTGFYGGDDPDDSSGVLNYVRVEFAGRILSPDNELNGIAFQGVGRGTEVDNIHVHMNKDDGVEFFGGTVNVKHIIITGVADDMLDWTDGWTGKVQYAVLQQYSDAGDNGIEADNSGEDNTATPRSHPTISNVTIIGSGSDEFSSDGMRLREGTAANIYNAAVMNFAGSCVKVANVETYENAWDTDHLSGELTIMNSRVTCDTNFKDEYDFEEDGETKIPGPFTVADDLFGADDAGNSTGDLGLTDPTNTTSPNWAPEGGSALLGAGAAPDDSFFDDADYIGAIGSDDWTTWTEFPAN